MVRTRLRTRESVQMLGHSMFLFRSNFTALCTSVLFSCNFKERCMTHVALCVLTRVVVRAPHHENPQHVGPAPAATGCGDPSRQRCRHLDRRLRPFLSERNRYSAVRQTASCAPPGRAQGAHGPSPQLSRQLYSASQTQQARQKQRLCWAPCFERSAVGLGTVSSHGVPNKSRLRSPSCSLPVGRSSSTPVVARRLSTPTPCLSSSVAWTQLATETVAQCWAAASRAGKPPLWSRPQSSRR